MMHSSIEPIENVGAPFVDALCVDVAIPLPIEGSFSYAVGAEDIDRIKRGVRVRVPFKNREIVGFVVGFRDFPLERKLKKVLNILDDEPVLSERTLRLTEWLAKYYFASWGEAIEAAVPKWVKEGKRWSEKSLPETSYEKEPAAALEPTEEQRKALPLIQAALNEKSPQPILLHGITGSGKTELYIQAIHIVLNRGKGAIVLVPEIVLTEQLRRFFAEHFGNRLEILHSKLSDGERFSAWKRIESGQKRILLGPRSALFAPMKDLGLIVIDEEQEASYKQEQTPRYHAREVAIWLAREERALLILGSATPSLESSFLADQGIFQRIELTKRVENKELPGVTLVDLKSEREIHKRPVILSRLLVQEIQRNLERHEGTLLLLNRRGFSTQIHCPGCGEVLTCPSCQVSLTFHQGDNHLLCHYCNFKKEPDKLCPRCQMPLLRFLGFGTEKVESEVARIFPHARVARMDTDAIRRKGSHETILQNFRNQQIDILVGTQMIAKGFDFPHVTLVGVVLADVGLVLPDFRSGERTFQLLTQVAGRAGRGQKKGRVIIQTYSPYHPSVACAQRHDYQAFYAQELAKRREYGYPPCRSLINLIIRSRVEKKAYLFARKLRDALVEKGIENETDLLGPAPLPFYRLRGHFRWHVLIKTKNLEETQHWLLEGLRKNQPPSGVAFQVDVNPLNIL